MSLKLQNIKIEVDRLNTKLYEKISHTYLTKYISRPKIDEHKGVFLYGLLHQSKYNNIDDAYIAIMLVDLALAVHDEVPTKLAKQESEVKGRQLTVLAGDYFSSLYYSSLAGINDLRLIKTVSIAIQDINELKMDSYLFDNLDVEKLFSNTQMISSHLFSTIAISLGFKEWSVFANNYFILKEIAHNNKGGSITQKAIQHMFHQHRDFVTLKAKGISEQINGLMKKNNLFEVLFHHSYNNFKIDDILLEKVMGDEF
jgi:heptaprenyl diphosphate synthase